MGIEGKGKFSKIKKAAGSRQQAVVWKTGKQKKRRVFSLRSVLYALCSLSG
jgi:hypothetical protein